MSRRETRPVIEFGPFVDGYHDVADQMIHDLRRRAEFCFRRREAEKDALTSVAAFESYRGGIRRRFLDAIGGLPDEREALNPTITGRIERGGFAIEKLLYESLPQVYVTAALYLPAALREPVPAVLFVHGHAEEGKAYPNYQAVCSDLARSGFVVLAVDPPGQGERYQYLDPQTGERIVGGCTTEHTYAGLPFVLAGASVSRHFVWDAIRGVDYLCTRPEVDPTRIGVTGNSGGGTQTVLLMMSEPRFAAAVPCTFVMTLESYLRTGQPQDAEQIVRGAIAFGPDHDDYLTAMAPKPVLVGAVASDYFPIEGAREAVRRAKRIYDLYGAGDRLDLAVDASRHEYSRGLREAAVNWFRRHLQGRPPDFVSGPQAPLAASDLLVTPEGQVLRAYPGGRALFDLSRDYIRRLPSPARTGPLCGAAVATWVTDGLHGTEGHSASDGMPREPEAAESRRRALRDGVVDRLGGQGDRAAPIDARVIWEGEWEGRRAEKVFFFSEPDMVVTGVFLAPADGAGPTPGFPGPSLSAAEGAEGAPLIGEPVRRPTDLVLLPNGTASSGDSEGMVREILGRGRGLFLFDVRGTGAVLSREINPHGRDSVFGTEFRLAMDAMMLGISTLGLRVFDALRAYDYLRGRGDVSEVGLVAAGPGASIGFFAAALQPGFGDLRFIDALTSYRDIGEVEYYSRDVASYARTPWGIARDFDLVDLLPLLAPRAATFTRPRGPRGEVIDEATWRTGFVDLAAARGYLDSGWQPQRDDMA